MINYTKVAKAELQEILNMFPNYSLGEILYSFSRFSGENVKWMLKTTDQDLFSMIEKAIKTEKDEE